MTKFRKLTRNSLYNIAGSAAPLLVGVATIPSLVHSLGVDRFGILTLTWVVMGYFSLFDMGLGRALTQIVAEKSGNNSSKELPDIIHTALGMMLGFGVIGGICLVAISPLIVGKVLKLPHELHVEAYYAFCLMGISIPAVTLLAGLRGILEARQHFLAISALRGIMGAWTFLGPWLVSLVTVNLLWIVLSLELMRYVAVLAHYVVCNQFVHEMKEKGRLRLEYWRVLWKFGGWMTLSNIISPIMVSMDRFFIGAFISVGSIAYYSTPYEVTTKAFAISNAIVTVLFPMFGSNYKIDPIETRKYYNKGIYYILLTVGTGLILMGVSARYVLGKWLGVAFALNSTTPMRILCFGVILNAVAAVPYAYIQGIARPDVTAKFHIVEVPFYIILIWVLGNQFGIIGVAWAWAIRVAVDLMLLLITANKFQKFYINERKLQSVRDNFC